MILSLIFIDLQVITVLEATLTGRQTRLEITVFDYGNPMSNKFHKTLLLKIHELNWKL